MWADNEIKGNLKNMDPEDFEGNGDSNQEKSRVKQQAWTQPEERELIVLVIDR